MISPVIGHDREFRTSVRDHRFGVSTPRTEPLVAAAEISFTKREDGIEISIQSPTSDITGSSAREITDQFVGHTAKDVIRYPTSSRAHANYALALAKAGRDQDAETAFRTALDLDRDSYLANISLATIYVDQGRYDEASAAYQALLASKPNDRPVLVSLALLALRQNDYALAKHWLERASTLKNTAFSQFLSGIIHLQVGDTKAAIGALREAARLDVRTVAYHNALGIAYAATEDYGRAERSFKIALAIAPESQVVLYSLCEILLDRGRADGVIGLLKAHVGDDTASIEARELLAQAYFLESRYTTARTQIWRILRTLGQSGAPTERARHLNNLAATFAKEGATVQAERYFREAIAVSPSAYANAYHNLAQLYIFTDRRDEAVSTLERAVRRLPGDQSLRRLLAHAYALDERLDEAVAQLSPFWKAGSGDADTYAGLGSLYERSGDIDSAITVLQDGISKHRSNPGIINNLAYFNLQLGHVEEARATLALLPRSTVPHVELVATFGLLRLWQGDWRAATDFYGQAERLAREDGKLDLARRVKQKLHLELAQYWLRKGDRDRARHEIKLGLAVHPKSYGYTRELKELSGKALSAPDRN